MLYALLTDRESSQKIPHIWCLEAKDVDSLSRQSFSLLYNLITLITHHQQAFCSLYSLYYYNKASSSIPLLVYVYIEMQLYTRSRGRYALDAVKWRIWWEHSLSVNNQMAEPLFGTHECFFLHNVIRDNSDPPPTYHIMHTVILATP